MLDIPFPLVSWAWYGMWLYQFLVIRFSLSLWITEYSLINYLSLINAPPPPKAKMWPNAYRIWLQDTKVLRWASSWQNQQTDCALSEDSDQPGHSPSLIRVFAVRMKTPWALSYPLSALSAQRRLWSDWADAQADLSLRWANTHFVGFVV